jgi:site-specific DNA recombinase
LNNTAYHDLRRAILYARVSTRKQANGGYSLAQHMEVLREYAAHEGYEVLEEIVDRGKSGASLERPGMDRVRHLVAAGRVSAVLAQDKDRFAREPEYLYLLRREFEEQGCKLSAVNDRGLIDDHLAKWELKTTAERSRRAKLRKAREGKIVAVTSPTYGFRFNATRDSYEVNEDTMRVVRRIFCMVGVEKRPLNAVKRTLEGEKVPTPTGNRHWLTQVIRGFVLDDVYRPHTLEEVADLVTPEVAATLEPDKRYGIWWFNRERWTKKQVSEVSAHGRVYRQSVKATPRPREERIAVPVPDSGVPPEVVDAAREIVLKNKANPKNDDRVWELSGGILCCGTCGRRMRTCVARKKSDQRYYYYACARGARPA